MGSGSRVLAGDGRSVEVSPSGEPVKVRTTDGRVVTISRKLLDIFPEKYTPIIETSAANPTKP